MTRDRHRRTSNRDLKGIRAEPHAHGEEEIEAGKAPGLGGLYYRKSLGPDPDAEGQVLQGTSPEFVSERSTRAVR